MTRTSRLWVLPLALAWHACASERTMTPPDAPDGSSDAFDMYDTVSPDAIDVVSPDIPSPDAIDVVSPDTPSPDAIDVVLPDTPSPDAIDATVDIVSSDAFDASPVDARPDQEDAGGHVCDVEQPVVKLGCVETPLAPTLSVDGISTRVVGYTCRADNVDPLVRIRACITPPSNPCIADAGESLCAVVDIPAAALATFVPDATVSLDGTTTFTFTGPIDFEVKPENVVYTPIRTTPVTRVWMESRCFCSPIPSMTGRQTVQGGLTIIHASSDRVRGRLSLSAVGHIAPVNYRDRQIELDAFFEVALTRPAQ